MATCRPAGMKQVTAMVPRPVRVAPAPVRDLHGHGYTLPATYWSPVGDQAIAIEVRLAGAPADIIHVGQSIDDLAGNPYIVHDVGRLGEGAFMSLYVTAITPALAAAVDAARRAADEDRRIANDPRLPRVKELVREAIDRTATGWYVDVYLGEDGDLHVGNRVSTGFRTHPRQDGLHVIFRAEADYAAFEDGRMLHRFALGAVAELRDH